MVLRRRKGKPQRGGSGHRAEDVALAPNIGFCSQQQHTVRTSPNSGSGPVDRRADDNKKLFANSARDCLGFSSLNFEFGEDVCSQFLLELKTSSSFSALPPRRTICGFVQIVRNLGRNPVVLTGESFYFLPFEHEMTWCISYNEQFCELISSCRNESIALRPTIFLPPAFNVMSVQWEVVKLMFQISLASSLCEGSN
jgi:hypothetical protein